MSTKPVRTCSAEGCTRKHYAKGGCIKHYARLKKHGDMSVTLVNVEHAATCAESDCGRPYVSSGLCKRHSSNKWARTPDKIWEADPAA